ncbi:MAG: hypothetical protein H0T63_11575 [Pyrinomonadaceae bacterium]|nr:hypothetical protein [Pyrinomonadaceae bacterium]
MSLMLFLGFLQNSIQLVPDGTIFLHIALIIFMVYVLNATLFRPINRILEERERRTRGRSGEAQDTLRRVDANLKRYENSLREARVEGYQRLEQERAEAMRVRQAQVDKVRAEVTQSIAEQKTAIQVQTTEARASLEGDARRIAGEISSQLLRRPGGGVSSAQPRA